MLGLERHVVDPEALVQHLGDLAPASVAVLVGAYQDVRGERREP